MTCAITPYATFIRVNIAVMSYAELARRIHVDAEHLRRWCIANGCARPKAWQPFTSEGKTFVADNWRSMSDFDMAERLGVPETTVKTYRQSRKWHRANPKNGVAVWQQSGQARRAIEAQQVKPREDMAAEYIARHDRVPVFRIDANGHPTKRGNQWRYGTARLTCEQMLAKAQRKGWAA